MGQAQGKHKQGGCTPPQLRAAIDQGARLRHLVLGRKATVSTVLPDGKAVELSLAATGEYTLQWSSHIAGSAGVRQELESFTVSREDAGPLLHEFRAIAECPEGLLQLEELAKVLPGVTKPPPSVMLVI